MAPKYGSWFKVAVAGGIAFPACSGGTGDGSDGTVDAGTDSPAMVAPDTSVPDAGIPDTGLPDTSMPATDAGADVMDAAPEAEAAACQPESGDTTAPTITSAALIDPGQVEITFSEPVQPPAAVDATKFRLSLSFLSDAEGTYTYYRDISYYFGALRDYSFSSLAGTCTNTVIATLADSIDVSAVCGAINQINAGQFSSKASLYLHFREADSPTVVDRAGNNAPDVSASWTVGNDAGRLTDERQVAGDFPEAPVLVNVSCPTDAGSDAGDAATD